MHQRYETEHKRKILLTDNSHIISRLPYIFGFIFLIPRYGKKGKYFVM